LIAEDLVRSGEGKGEGGRGSAVSSVKPRFESFRSVSSPITLIPLLTCIRRTPMPREATQSATVAGRKTAGETPVGRRLGAGGSPEVAREPVASRLMAMEAWVAAARD